MPAMTAHQYDECVQHNLAADVYRTTVEGPLRQRQDGRLLAVLREERT